MKTAAMLALIVLAVLACPAWAASHDPGGGVSTETQDYLFEFENATAGLNENPNTNLQHISLTEHLAAAGECGPLGCRSGSGLLQRRPARRALGRVFHRRC